FLKKFYKGFIKLKNALFILLTLFIKKYNNNLRFYINFKKLNEIIKKDCYF
ncbi:uncharacterized protein BDZ83DRAFT_593261, partial [Colletotrichum acutatum]